jgi:hypothetical protein
MPVVSFPCAIHRFVDSRPNRRRVWIKGHDLRALALAATAQLRVAVDQCAYGIVRPESVESSLFLEVDHPEGDALVGPMAGPVPPPSMSADERRSLDDLIAALGFSQSPGARQLGHYEVIVKYSPIGARPRYPPVREKRDTDAHYQKRLDAAQEWWIERARHQGIHLVKYDVPPRDWTAHDVEMLMLLAYQLLPTNEPRWRECGLITQDKAGCRQENGGRFTVAPYVQSSRGDYVAHVHLPAFPTCALVDWVASRHYEINLRHPVMKLELAARGWRCRDAARPHNTEQQACFAPVRTLTF